MIDADAIAQMKPGVVLVNTSRGGLVDTEALIEGLKSHKVGAACLDVYEEEGDLFYEDCSEEIVADDTLVRLISMPNVIVKMCIRDRLFTVDGLIEDEGQIGNLILEEISGVLTSGLSKVVTNLLASIKLQAYSPPLPIETDRIHVANGTYFMDGSFTACLLYTSRCV